MILVTVGTHQDPFDRLVDALADLPADRLVVQYGNGRPPAAAAVAKPFMAFAELRGWFERADAVVTHAGVGSFLMAWREGHTPLIVPRRHSFGEHVDDHQVDLCRALETEERAVVVWDEQRLAELVAAAPPRQPPRATVAGPLHDAVRSEIRRAAGS